MTGPVHPRPDGKRLLGSGFPGDDGNAAPAVAAALGAYRAGSGSYAAALAALLDSRVLVPVVAVLGEVDEEVRADGTTIAHDKSSDMATVLLTGADGRQALLAFTSTQALQTWQADARPVPVSFRDAAKAAVQDEADAVVVDLAGPVPFAIEGEDLRAVASGYELAFVGGSTAWVAPAES